MTKSVYVHLPFGWDPDGWPEQYQRGLVNDVSPYGFHRAREFGFDVVLSKDAAASPFLRRLQQRIARRFHSVDLVHAYRNRRAMRDADAVWTMLDGEGLAVAALMAVGLVERKPLIGNMVWLFDKWKRFGPVRRRVLRRLCRQFASLTVHSEGCLPVSRMALPGIDVKLMPFGINTESYAVTPPVLRSDEGPIRILGTGNDASRDWQTFLQAFAGDPRFSVTMVCRNIDESDTAQYANVTLVRDPTMAAFRSLYADAHFVIVPMHGNVFSGITVALEAAALGIPVISTRTGGVPTYFAEEEVLYVPIGDAASMKRVALETSPEERRRFAERAQRRFCEADYSTRGMMGRYAAMTCPPAAARAGVCHAD